MDRITLNKYSKQYGVKAANEVLDFLNIKSANLKSCKFKINVPEIDELLDIMHLIDVRISNPLYASDRDEFYEYMQKFISALLKVKKIKNAKETLNSCVFNMREYQFEIPKSYFKEKPDCEIIELEEPISKSNSEKTFSDIEWNQFVIGVITAISLIDKILEARSKIKIGCKVMTFRGIKGKVEFVDGTHVGIRDDFDTLIIASIDNVKLIK